MKANPPVPEHQMMQFILGKWISKPIHAAAKLDIAEIIKDSKMDIHQIAKRTKTHPDSLYRLMRALSALGIFEEKENKTFVNTPMSLCLVKDKLKPAALLFHSSWHDAMWDNLLYSVQTGKSAFEHLHDMPVFDWFDTHKTDADIFHDANAFKAGFTHKAILDIYDFSIFKSITDVGGGIGSLMFAILEKHPALKGKVAELPEVMPGLKKSICKNNLKKRCQALECDFFKSIPQGSDAYILSHILHDWPDKACKSILTNIKKAMGPQGKLL
ncbi:MAG: methyltransferase, partial [Desulfobacteraceae bacterium]|nr:methyltransferase [Desulfobacteraceae bacterium]